METSLFFIYMNKYNEIITNAIDTEYTRYNGLSNILIDLEFTSSMRRYGKTKNITRFRNSLLYLGMIEETLQALKDGTHKI